MGKPNQSLWSYTIENPTWSYINTEWKCILQDKIELHFKLNRGRSYSENYPFGLDETTKRWLGKQNKSLNIKIHNDRILQQVVIFKKYLKLVN